MVPLLILGNSAGDIPRIKFKKLLHSRRFIKLHIFAKGLCARRLEKGHMSLKVISEAKRAVTIRRHGISTIASSGCYVPSIP